MALKTALQKVETTMTEIVSNPSESGVVIKVSSLFVSNTSNNSISVDVEMTRDGTGYSVIKSGVIPSGKTLSVFISKDVGIYLEEGDSLGLKASSSNSLDAVCSYSEVDPAAACTPLCLE